MSRSFTSIRRLLTAFTLAGAIAAIVAAQAIAAVPSGTGHDTDGWYPYAVSYTQSQAQADTDGWYPYAVSYTQSQQALAATPVSDVASSLQVARGDRTAGVSIVSDTVNSLGVARRNASAQALRAATSGQSSFDWTSAGIGAGGVVTLVLVTLAGGLALRRRGRLAI
jgi:hypothetical protein